MMSKSTDQKIVIEDLLDLNTDGIEQLVSDAGVDGLGFDGYDLAVGSMIRYAYLKWRLSPGDMTEKELQQLLREKMARINRAVLRMEMDSLMPESADEVVEILRDSYIADGEEGITAMHGIVVESMQREHKDDAERMLLVPIYSRMLTQRAAAAVNEYYAKQMN